MGTKLARRPAIVIPRGPSPQLVKMRQAMAARALRARRESSSRQAMVVGAVAAALLGYADKKQVSLPTVSNVDPSLLYGGIGVLASATVVRGSAGKLLGDAGAGLLAIAAYRYASDTSQSAKKSGVGAVEGEWEDVP